MPGNLSFRRVWTRDLLIAIGIALFIIVFFYQPVKIEGDSMAPLLSDQERVFINMLVYHFEPIERGDVVVFWNPLDRTECFIKRLLPCRTRPSRSGTAWSTSMGTRFLSLTSHHDTRI